jgi:hypothetical protein
MPNKCSKNNHNVLLHQRAIAKHTSVRLSAREGADGIYLPALSLPLDSYPV